MRIDTDAALRAFAPEQFGMRAYKHGWLAEFAGIGTVAFASLMWPHAQAPARWRSEHTNALGLLVRLQQEVWGFPAEEAVPVNVLSILEDTGAAVLVAYELNCGFNEDGWLGFAFGMGTRSGPMYSHMLGVREDVRGGLDLGWYLKVLQGYLALRSGHDAMTWTFDPMRGANARLNLEKLGATMVNLTVDKYGTMRSSLYGDVPTDRFTAKWNLLAPAVHCQIKAVSRGEATPRQLSDIEGLPVVTGENVDKTLKEAPDAVVYEIPGDIDALMRSDPPRATAWRQEMRDVFGTLMTRRIAAIDDAAKSEGPIAVGLEIRPGLYDVTGFATEIVDQGERLSYYVLERKDLR